MNIKLTAKKMMKNPDIYWVYLKREGKQLEIRDFSFGCSEPNLESVLESIGDDYRLFLASPTLADFISNVGENEDSEERYNTLKEYMKDCLEFFTENELESLNNQE